LHGKIADRGSSGRDAAVMPQPSPHFLQRTIQVPMTPLPVG
jgi:hypothetical protein